MSSTDRILLAIDTATPVVSVALTTGTRLRGKVLSCLSFSSNTTHSHKLLNLIDIMLSEAVVSREMISGIAVGLGPGSFTGLRIGMATAKGLVAAARVPLYGVSSLDMIVAGCMTEYLICAVLDARKKEVYTAFYRCNAHGFPTRNSEMMVISPAALAECVREPVVMIGDAVYTYGDYWQSVLGELFVTAPTHLHNPSAAALGLLAGEQMQTAGQPLDVAEAVPIYIRASDAELNLLKHGAAISPTISL